MIPFIVNRDWYEQYWLQEPQMKSRKGLFWGLARFAAFLRESSRSGLRSGRSTARAVDSTKWLQAVAAIVRLRRPRIVSGPVTSKQRVRLFIRSGNRTVL
jgi:hypothetical protein